MTDFVVGIRETPAPDWLPIETAPKDGTEIIVWTPIYGGKVLFARWETNRYAKMPRPYWSFSDERIWGISASRANPPTHWMPLPALPVSP